MMKRILITGSNGLLGQKIVEIGRSYDEFNLIASSKGDNRISASEIDFHTLDITDISSLTKVFEEIKPDYVINTAAMTNVDACESDKSGAKALNVEAVANLIQVCAKFNCHLIHLSTDFIFDGENGPYSEEDLPNPLSFYGFTKYSAEKLILDSVIEWTIVRTVLVYGEVENMSRSNIVLWAKGALESGTELNIVDDQFRTPTLADDLAVACLEIAKRNKTGIFNVSGKDFMSIHELVKRIATHFSYPTDNINTLSSSTLNQAAKRPPVTGFKIEKARRELAYNPRSFEQGLDLIFSA